jgi:hypothetical protein
MTTPPRISILTEFKALVLHMAWKRREFIRDVDGRWLWVPSPGAGAYNSAHLHMLVKLLEEGNRKWEKQIQDYFEKEQNGTV